MSIPSPVWTPGVAADIPINQYRAHINRKFKQNLQDSHELHQWSVSAPQDFWVDLWSYTGLVPELPHTVTQAYDPEIPMNEIPRFFEGASINYTENVLTQPSVDPDAPAIIGLREGQGLDGETWSWGQLREKVRQIRSALARSGIRAGDRVAALISTSNWSVAIFLATASLGAVFTSIASDLGTEGCISRLQQIQPSIVFADSHTTYKGTQRSNLAKISDILARLGHSKPAVVLIPLHQTSHSFIELSAFLSKSRDEDPLEFERVPFSEPLYVLYSSGTSGPPKCLVHQHGVILQHRKISLLHNSLRPGEVVFQFSSPSWVLWNIMVGHLSAGTTLVLYDGSPTYPSPEYLLSIVEKYKVAYWGVSPRYLQQLESTGVQARTKYDLRHLRMVQTGGSHLAASQYHWFYATFPSRVHLTSVTGGTDIVTSWVGTDPAGPVYAGELQLPILGHDIDVLDPATGESVKHLGLAGEFVCRQPFPSMPIFFWGDDGNQMYQASYFNKFDFPIWAQHDWASFNPITGGCQVHGRSDGVLNPQGIRFGSSEIYSITEARPFSDVIETTLCVGRRRDGIDSDEAVFLFVIMRPGLQFDADLDRRLRSAIRAGLGARHVPRFVFPVKEIPTTVNGKKVETLVKRTISTGALPKKVSSTVANAHCLEDFRQFYFAGDEPVRAKL